VTTTVRTYLSLGSNIDPERNLRSAIDALRERFGALAVSKVYRFPAVGFVGPDFLNAAVAIDCDIDPFALNRWLHELERQHGRIRANVKFSSRSLDIDIIYFGDLVLDGPGELVLPRPELNQSFVLKPMAELAPELVDPICKRTLRQLWDAHPDRDREFPALRI
jgi:2-amino-4-hydroxy-6-hydroxymethyldihydropteridine diphosphokinase